MDRLYRSRTNRVIGGVCGGLAEYFKVDAFIVRILFVTLALMFSGTGLPVYLLLWLFIPEQEQPFADHNDTIRQNIQDIRNTAVNLRNEAFGVGGSAKSDRLLLGGAIFVGVGLLLLLRNLHVLSFFNDLWPLGMIAVGILILIQNLKNK